MQQDEQVREQMYAHIEQWKQSGLSQKRYCEQQAVKYHVFHYWYKLYRDQHQQAVQEPESTSPAAFIPLMLSASPATTAFVELHLCGGHRLVFHQMISADYLKTLIR
jgi:hypothetical protein